MNANRAVVLMGFSLNDVKRRGGQLAGAAAAGAELDLSANIGGE
jgi:hypothetical protein